MITAIVGFYQDRPAGEHLLKNLKEHGIKSIWVDSRIEPFTKVKSDYSTDGLPEIIKSYDAELYQLGATKPGVAFQTLLEKAAKKGDWALNLSTDEYLEGDWDTLCQNARKLKLTEPARCGLRFLDHNPISENKKKDKVDRLIYLPGRIFIEEIHWMYFWRDEIGRKRTLVNNPLVEGMTIHHDDRLRPDWRNKLMDKFQADRKPVEMQAWQKILRPYDS